MLLAIAGFAESPFSALPVVHNNVIVTGVSATMVAGNPVITGTANLTLTGATAQTNVGNTTVAADANTTVTGQLLNTAINGVTVTANANVIPTGVQANSEVGIIGTNAWQLINTGASNNWTEVALVA